MDFVTPDYAANAYSAYPSRKSPSRTRVRDLSRLSSRRFFVKACPRASPWPANNTSIKSRSIGGVHINFSALSRQHLLDQLLRAPLPALPSGTCVPILQGPLRGPVLVSWRRPAWLLAGESRICSATLSSRNEFSAQMSSGTLAPTWFCIHC